MLKKWINTLKSPALFSAILIVPLLLSCSEDQGILNTSESINTLSEQETVDLQFLREEEKLAHDVYLYAYEKHAFMTFKNIASSEQQHTDRVKALLESYQIEDPALVEEGVFANPTLQQLYNDLTAKVNLSLIDALEVGATIEDLDIRDLNTMAENSQKEDIRLLYDQLACGSANHMRSFYSQLQNQGVEYQVQFISEDQMAEILSEPVGGCGN